MLQQIWTTSRKNRGPRIHSYQYMEQKQGTKKALHMFYVELKPKSNNKDIYEIGSFLDSRLKFEPYSKCKIPCINSQRGTVAQKVFAIRSSTSNAQETIEPSIAHAGRNPRTLNAFCAKATSSQLQRLYGL